jgi:hypothetical protein
MTRVWLATIKEGKPKMEEYVRAYFNDWCRENEGKMVRIEPQKNPVSQQLRSYYFGCILPLVRETCDQWKNLNSDEMHEVIKKTFFAFEAWNPLNRRIERFGRSVMSDTEWNNSIKASAFLDVLGDYLIQNGKEIPDPSEYKAWRDSAPEVGEEFEDRIK